MTSQDFTRFVLLNRNQLHDEVKDENAVIEIAHLVSGSLIYRLYEGLILHAYDMDALTEHLESLYDAEENLALLYFVFMLCEATDIEVSEHFEYYTAKAQYAPYLSAAVIEDWLDFHGDYED